MLGKQRFGALGEHREGSQVIRGFEVLTNLDSSVAGHFLLSVLHFLLSDFGGRLLKCTFLKDGLWNFLLLLLHGLLLSLLLLLGRLFLLLSLNWFLLLLGSIVSRSKGLLWLLERHGLGLDRGSLAHLLGTLVGGVASQVD